ncbi:MAG: flagellar type III secretion system pore protein FliP [Phycisphaerales bacterium JB050]
MKIRGWLFIIGAFALSVFVPDAIAQSVGEIDPLSPMPGVSSSETPPVAPGGSFNPIEMLEDSADAIPGFEGGLSGALNIMVLLTVLSLVPAIMIMCTCFIRFIIVLGLLKQALGTQSLPPSQVLLALSLFMTFMVMAPTIDRIYDEAIVPYQQGEVQNQVEMWEKAKQPLRDFMFAQIEEADTWSTVFMLMEYRTGEPITEPQNMTRADVDMLTLIPAYMLSELKIAFLMGFRIYLPFLVIDMVVASLLISMSMMMLPPVLVSLPFKILLFILVDGWALIVGSLMQSVAPVETATVALIPHAPLIASTGLV